MKLTKLFLALAAFGSMAIASEAMAQPPSQSFVVKATVKPSCNINSIPTIDFGDYDPLSATDLTANGSISITCTNKASVTIGLTAGADFGNGSNRMKGPSPANDEHLEYKLYQPNGSTQWSDSEELSGNITGTGSVLGITGQGRASPVVSSIVAKMRAGQNVSVGAYSDTVYAILNF